jgi:hypothetical protein
MKHVTGLVFTFAAALALTAPAFAADPPAKTNAQGMPLPGNPGAFASNEAPPTVPPAAPGVFQVQKRGANRFHLVLTGHKFVSRHAAELYLAYRASEITAEQKGSWFTFTESRTKGDTAPVPKRDPAANRFSFRMEFFRPVWRYKTSAAAEWKRWSPFSGVAFPENELKNASVYELSADITVHKGFMDDADPLAFEAGAVNDFLVNQVSPPQ